MGEFIQTEKVIEKQKNIKSVLRFLWNLTLLRWFFVPSFIFIMICSVIPQYFLWYVGKLVECSATWEEICHVTHHFFSWNVSFPISIKILGYIVMAAFIARLLSWTLFEIGGKWSMQKIHYNAMQAISKTRTTFFDENPSGRIINRMVGDFFRLEWAIIQVGDTMNSTMDVLCVGVLLYIANPLPAILVIPLVVGYFLLQFQWAPMLSHARELVSISFGEVLHRETDVIEGRDLFLLYDKEKSLMHRLHKAYLRTVNMGLLVAKIQWWGELWMAGMTISFSILVYIFLVVGIHNHTISVVFAAIIITAILNLTDIFHFLTWSVTHLGGSAANIRRVFEYVDLPDEIDEERTGPVSGQKLKPEILSGDIRFIRYTMSYRKNSKQILQNVTLTIPEGKKIGIVGRTGAGKTSFFQSLFRMVHVHHGDIKIGNRSIFDIQIDSLRSLFGVVPQDPYLFSGTVRSNLSGDKPEINDSIMEQALKMVKLDFSLDAKVTEGGKDYSVGERQLLCLARVMISEKPYILMDEPTSSVDMITDALIQTMLETHLKDRTVITIAHRLDSLWNYDLIIEFKDGMFYRKGKPEKMIPLILKNGGKELL